LVPLVSIDWPSSQEYPWDNSIREPEFPGKDCRLRRPICIQSSEGAFQTVTWNEGFLQIRQNYRYRTDAAEDSF
jgi:hypothetical protein